MSPEYIEMPDRPRPRAMRLEMIVLVGVLVGIAGVVGPVVTEEAADKHRSRARLDLEALARAVDGFLKTQPTSALQDDDGAALVFMTGPGLLPSNNVFDIGPEGDWQKILQRVAPDLPGTDPWGQSYIINLSGLTESSEHIQVVSAGPNGQINTQPTSVLPGGDDLMIVID